MAANTTAVAATLSAMETTATTVVDGLRRRSRSASRVSSIVLISLLVSQRYHGIDLGRPAGGNRGGYNSDQDHRDRHRNQHNRIIGGSLIDDVGQQLACGDAKQKPHT